MITYDKLKCMEKLCKNKDTLMFVIMKDRRKLLLCDSHYQMLIDDDIHMTLPIPNLLPKKYQKKITLNSIIDIELKLTAMNKISMLPDDVIMYCGNQFNNENKKIKWDDLSPEEQWWYLLLQSKEKGWKYGTKKY